jgi:uncharacterized protein YndB with AHSA1/START domain
MSTPHRAYKLTEEIWIDAPPERVFRALTEPDELIAWWAIPEAYGTTEAKVDLRVGGQYRLTGWSRERGVFAVEGTYEVVEPPARLVYTWNPDWDEGATGSRVSFELEPADGGTRVTVRHSAFAAEASRDAHKNGWPAILAAVRDHATRPE